MSVSSFAISILLFILNTSPVSETGFPHAWLGKWEGTLNWQRPGMKTELVPMSLTIAEAENGRFHWKISYGEGGDDHRPYSLYLKDSSRGHWVIDEHNGILLDQYWIGDMLVGSFSVNNTTINNQYGMQNGELHIEFHSYSNTKISESGGEGEIPPVKSFHLVSYQKAVLRRVE